MSRRLSSAARRHLVACADGLDLRARRWHAQAQRDLARGRAVCRRERRHRWCLPGVWPMCLRCGGAMTLGSWLGVMARAAARGAR